MIEPDDQAKAIQSLIDAAVERGDDHVVLPAALSRAECAYRLGHSA